MRRYEGESRLNQAMKRERKRAGEGRGKKKRAKREGGSRNKGQKEKMVAVVGGGGAMGIEGREAGGREVKPLGCRGLG